MAVRLSAVRTGHPLPPGRFLVFTCVKRLIWPQGRSAATRIRSIEKFNDLVINRTHCLLACSIVAQPTMLRRDFAKWITILNKWIIYSCVMYYVSWLLVDSWYQYGICSYQWWSLATGPRLGPPYTLRLCPPVAMDPSVKGMFQGYYCMLLKNGYIRLS
jgi:hypothetical protein